MKFTGGTETLLFFSLSSHAFRSLSLPDWYIYWQNPGDSGQPPALKWQIPDGFTVGEIQWPRPEKLKNGPLDDYGYKDEVTLLASLQVPIRQEGMRIEIAADATWLV